MSTFYNVVSRKEIPNSGGKVIHNKVGIIKVTPNKGWYLSLFHLPNDFQIFANQNEELPVIDFNDHEA
ncbi:hypothetical protein [Psychroserpens sp. SPM9]|uniref:hypothetical protein n=1 Tax=Psychroserpens sp. SPM9 TaxID=2975598 RepID=UPI0021A86F73|nr:hypothetical protein [Psychroserpens sp. SPM9]MDG5490617.1 hypothetical protein [Psychroserpens sp. SPM9]